MTDTSLNVHVYYLWKELTGWDVMFVVFMSGLRDFLH